jgi:superoxide dismutase, Fe-Mn family
MAGHANHSFFWEICRRNLPASRRESLQKRSTSFQDQFTKAALSVFGSGWAWLSADDKRQLSIETSPNQDSPWMTGRKPLLGIDVWEHVYYLKYQNVRADYVAAFYKVISWNAVSDHFQNRNA